MTVRALTSENLKEAFTEYGKSVNSGPYSGLTTDEALDRMSAEAEAKGIWKTRDGVSVEGLGNFAAEVLGHADSGNLLPERRNGGGARCGFAGVAA